MTMDDPRSAAASFDAVICVTGHKAAGKDAFCDALKARGYTVRRFSDAIRDEAAARGIPEPTVEQLIELGNEGRAHGGPGHWASKLLEGFVAAGERLVCVNGARNPGEILTLRRLAGDKLVLVGVTAPAETRARRFLKRARLGDPTELMDFLRLDEKDRGLGQPSDGQQVDRCMAQVPYEDVFNNAGTLEEFEAWTLSFLARHGLP